MDPMCHDGVCAKCWSVKYIVLGGIVLITSINWPDKIWHVLGVLLIIKGLIKWAMPACGHCQPSAAKKGKK